MGANNCERDDFLALNSELMQQLHGDEDEELHDFYTWYKEVLNYNLLGGKLTRGIMVSKSFSLLAKKDDVTTENIKLAHTMGWCLELLQAFFLVADDIMDNSVTRRGHPCWYKTHDLGPKGFNDALLMEKAVFHLMRKYHQDKPYYMKCVDLMNDVIYKTEKGQSLDLLTASGERPQLHLFTEERYTTIVKYKTSYYSFYLPVGLAMYMAGINDEKSHSEVKDVLLRIGHWFQVQDDYLDCFGDPEVMGKIGTDVEEGKCSWLVVTALKHVTPRQRETIEKCYGSDDPENVARVKSLYRDLRLPHVYKEFENSSRKAVLQDIRNMKNPGMQKLCTTFVNKIIDRNC